MPAFGPNDPSRSRAVVLVETRDLPHTELVERNFSYFLGPGWNFYRVDMGYITDEMQKSGYAISAFIKNYNHMLTSVAFWEQFTEEHILIIQPDTVCLSPLDERFFRYGMIGAPCGKLDKFTMNGGLSLRQRSVMLECLHATPELAEPEDVFFTRVIRDRALAPVPNLLTAMEFSVESLWNGYNVPFGVHGTDKGYLDPDVVGALLALATRVAPFD